MDIKRLILFLFILVGASASHAHQLNNTSESQLFENYALAMCLASEYTDGDIYNDAITSLNGYREFSNMPLESYTKLNAAYEKWSSIPYPSKEGGDINLARCIDFQNSKDIAVIFEEFNKSVK